MVLREMTKEQFNLFHNRMREKAQAAPLDASYTVRLVVNGEEYAVKLQPVRHCRIAVLQALHITRDQEGLHVALITQGGLLNAFLELLLYQGAA